MSAPGATAPSVSEYAAEFDAPVALLGQMIPRLGWNTLADGTRIYIEVNAEPDDLRIEGNCSAVDPETDRAAEEWIRSELESGNTWAWCRVEVTVTVDSDEDEDPTGTDYLGACSYRNRADFLACDYFADMVETALRAALGEGV